MDIHFKKKSVTLYVNFISKFSWLKTDLLGQEGSNIYEHTGDSLQPVETLGQG